jgi:hypothetical protein
VDVQQKFDLFHVLSLFVNLNVRCIKRNYSVLCKNSSPVGIKGMPAMLRVVSTVE